MPLIEPIRQVTDTESEWAEGVLQRVQAGADGLELVPAGDPSFARASTAYKQDGTQVGVDESRYETGQFGQTVMVEEGTTNILGVTIEELPSWGDRYGLYDEGAIIDETRQVDETLQFDENAQYIGEMLFDYILGVTHLI